MALTIREVSQILGILEKDVIALAENGEISAYKVGGVYLRFRPEQVEIYRKKLALNAEDAMKLRNETAEEKEEKDFEKKCKEMSFTELETTSKRTKNPSKKAIALMYFMKAILVRPELDSSLAKEYYSFLSNLPPTDFSPKNTDLFKETTSFLIQKGGIL